MSESEDEEQIEWKVLGSLSFDTNERSRFMARELKSVQVTTDADVMKLHLFQNHENKQNTHKQVKPKRNVANVFQVGIVAINVLGELLVDAAPPLPVKEIISADMVRPDSTKSKDELILHSFDSITLKEFQKLQRFGVGFGKV